MIKTAIITNLNYGIDLLQSISDKEYCNASVGPYYSSIGTHIRHVLDIFDCVFEGLDSKKINLIGRKRNQLIENEKKLGIEYFNNIIEKIEMLDINRLNDVVIVTDDLGLGKVSANYTIAGILMQAHSHAIHHFASLGYVIDQLKIQLPDQKFGLNPTTPLIF